MRTVKIYNTVCNFSGLLEDRAQWGGHRRIPHLPADDSEYSEVLTRHACGDDEPTDRRERGGYGY